MVENMNYMFYHCKKLNSLDLSKFDTKKVESAFYMFAGCTSLKSLNLSNFETPALKSMDGMFWGCFSLETLDMSKFNTEKVNNSTWTFSDCKKLAYINLRDYNGTDIFDFGDNYTYSNLVVCMNDYKQINTETNRLQSNNVKNNCSNSDEVVISPNASRIIITIISDKNGAYKYISEQFFKNNPDKGLRVWVEVQEGKWIHFRKRKPSDYLPDHL
jgi:surface protein